MIERMTKDGIKIKMETRGKVTNQDLGTVHLGLIIEENRSYHRSPTREEEIPLSRSPSRDKDRCYRCRQFRHFTKDCPSDKTGEMSKSEDGVQPVEDDGDVDFYKDWQVVAAMGYNGEAH